MADPSPGIRLTSSTQAALQRIATAPATSEQGLSGNGRIDHPDFSLPELLECLHSMQQGLGSQPLPLRGLPCADCAVNGGLYLMHSEALRLASPEERLELSKRWFCHDSPNMACRGNADNIGAEW